MEAATYSDISRRPLPLEGRQHFLDSIANIVKNMRWLKMMEFFVADGSGYITV